MHAERLVLNKNLAQDFQLTKVKIGFIHILKKPMNGEGLILKIPAVLELNQNRIQLLRKDFLFGIWENMLIWGRLK